MGGGGIEQETTQRARERDGAEPGVPGALSHSLPGKRGRVRVGAHAGEGSERGRMQDVFDGLHHIVHGAHPQHAGGACDRIEGFHGAGKRPGMGERGGAAFRRSAELHQHNGLAGRARHAAGRHEGLGVLHRFQVGDDHPDVVVHGVVADVVGAGEAGLVAGGDHRAGIDAAPLERALDRHGETAGLADDRDRPVDQPLQAIVRHGHEAGAGVQIAETIGAGDREPGLRDRRLEPGRQRAGTWIEGFAEAGGEHGGAACAGPARLDQRIGHESRRDDHHHVVGGLRQLGVGAIAARVPDLVAARIERIDRARKLVAVDVAPHPLRPVARRVAGAQDHHVARIEQRIDLAERMQQQGRRLDHQAHAQPPDPLCKPH